MQNWLAPTFVWFKLAWLGATKWGWHLLFIFEHSARHLLKFEVHNYNLSAKICYSLTRGLPTFCQPVSTPSTPLALTYNTTGIQLNILYFISTPLLLLAFTIQDQIMSSARKAVKLDMKSSHCYNFSKKKVYWKIMQIVIESFRKLTIYAPTKIYKSERKIGFGSTE